MACKPSIGILKARNAQMNISSKLLFILFTFLIFIGESSFAQKNYKLEIKASKKTEQSVINKIKYKKNFVIKSEIKKVLDLFILELQNESYVLATIDSVNDFDKTSLAYISLNEKYNWKRLGKGNLNPLLLGELNFDENRFIGADFNYEYLIEIEESIIQYYENHGHPFARISLDSIDITKSSVSAAIYCEQGPLIYIDSIMMLGFSEIHPHYIQQLLDIKAGDIYNESKIKRIKDQLASIPFAQEKNPYFISFQNKKATINLDLEKRRNNVFDGIVGLQPKSTIDNKMMLTGNLRLKLYNSFKRGELISIDWQSPGGGSQNLKLDFAYPYLFNTPIGLDYGFKLLKQDTSFINLTNSPGIRFIINGNNYIKVSSDFFSSNMLNPEVINGVPTNSDQLDINSVTGNMEVNLQHFDYNFNPRKGWHINILAGYGTKNIIKQHTVEDSFYDTIPLNSKQLKLKADLEFFIPLFKRQTIRVWSISEMMKGDYLVSNELYRIGGFSDFRGFNEQSIYASTYSILTLEWRLLLERNSFLSVFWNKAYVENSTGPSTTYDQPMGFGAGFSFETKAGIFALSYALGQQLGNPIEFSQAKIHFGYMARF